MCQDPWPFPSYTLPHEMLLFAVSRTHRSIRHSAVLQLPTLVPDRVNMKCLAFPNPGSAV